MSIYLNQVEKLFENICKNINKIFATGQLFVGLVPTVCCICRLLRTCYKLPRQPPTSSGRPPARL